MKTNNLKLYLVNEKHCVDVKGASLILGKAVGTVRNMTTMKDFPQSIKKGNKLYFEKSLLEEFKRNREVVEITE